jgi:hypothetical protein
MMRSCMSLISKEVNRPYQRNCIRSKQWKIQSCSFWLISCFHVFSSVLWYPPGLSLKNGVGIGLIPICLVGVRVFFKFIHVYWCPPRFPYQMMFVSFNSNTTDVISGAGIANYSGAPEFLVVFGFFLCNILSIIVCHVVLFLLVIILSVLLRITDSDFWRYQKGNQNPYIEDRQHNGQKKKKGQTTIYKTYT